MKRLAFLCILFASSFIIARGASAGDSPYTDPAKTIEAELCKDFTITLESNKTTGFGWDIATPIDEKVVKFISSEYVAAATGLVGSGGREMWTFRAVCPGRICISFKYIRPWEKDVPPAKKMTFTVCVKEPAKDNNKQEDVCSGQK